MQRSLRLIAIALVGVLGITDCKCSPRAAPIPACNAAPCTSTQDRVCLSLCAQIASKAGDPCSLDPCQPSPAVCDGDAGLTCVPIPVGRFQQAGRCQPIGYRGALAICDPNDNTKPCGRGLFCLDPTRSLPDCEPATPDTQAFPRSYCALTRLEGQSCDSTIDAPGCRACDIGLDCVGGVCKRHCGTDPDCPCTGVACFGASDAGSGTCNECEPGGAGTPCPSGYCCDHKLQCMAGACCLPNGAACTSRNDCCGRACVNGKCVSCTPCNQSPTTGSGDQCCSGEGFRSGVCFVPCPLLTGDPCKVFSFAGAPIQGQCQNGTVASCDNCGNYVCQPGKPSPEICNHLDDNCDGLVDNIPGTCPTFAPGGCKVTGHNACGTVNGAYQQTCDATPGVDFCTMCGQVVNGASCGACFGQSCLSERDCPPNSICSGPPAPTCQPQPGCPSSVSCWLPSDLGYNRQTCFGSVGTSPSDGGP